ncbi:MAG: hypothetical protein KGL39_00075 [Patescibacteria group bacterium]|nr:hypothetical protein [Patescibacteria group bacterium]
MNDKYIKVEGADPAGWTEMYCLSCAAYGSSQRPFGQTLLEKNRPSLTVLGNTITLHNDTNDPNKPLITVSGDTITYHGNSNDCNLLTGFMSDYDNGYITPFSPYISIPAGIPNYSCPSQTASSQSLMYNRMYNRIYDSGYIDSRGIHFLSGYFTFPTPAGIPNQSCPGQIVCGCILPQDLDVTTRMNQRSDPDTKPKKNPFYSKYQDW